jgi:anti-sigma factor RsiW
MSHDVTCREFVAFLDDYLSGALPAQQRAAFNAHLAVCPSCVAYMKTYKISIALGKAALSQPEGPVPEEAPEALVRAILSARKKA